MKYKIIRRGNYRGYEGVGKFPEDSLYFDLEDLHVALVDAGKTKRYAGDRGGRGNVAEQWARGKAAEWFVAAILDCEHLSKKYDALPVVIEGGGVDERIAANYHDGWRDLEAPWGYVSVKSALNSRYAAGFVFENIDKHRVDGYMFVVVRQRHPKYACQVVGFLPRSKVHLMQLSSPWNEYLKTKKVCLPHQNKWMGRMQWASEMDQPQLRLF